MNVVFMEDVDCSMVQKECVRVDDRFAEFMGAIGLVAFYKFFALSLFGGIR